jgi:hypothetical protein
MHTRFRMELNTVFGFKNSLFCAKNSLFRAEQGIFRSDLISHREKVAPAPKR